MRVILRYENIGYVLGDNWDSQDSRFEGQIDGSRFLGRAWLRVWPFARMGAVNP